MLAGLIVDGHAVICVSGRAKFMPKSVEKAFTEVI
jgi:sulfite reductase alpha subunit-like flavoprotein